MTNPPQSTEFKCLTKNNQPTHTHTHLPTHGYIRSHDYMLKGKLTYLHRGDHVMTMQTTYVLFPLVLHSGAICVSLLFVYILIEELFKGVSAGLTIEVPIGVEAGRWSWISLWVSWMAVIGNLNLSDSQKPVRMNQHTSQWSH